MWGWAAARQAELDVHPTGPGVDHTAGKAYPIGLRARQNIRITDGVKRVDHGAGRAIEHDSQRAAGRAGDQRDDRTACVGGRRAVLTPGIRAIARVARGRT